MRYAVLSRDALVCIQDLVGVLQRKTVHMLKLAGEMGRLEREPVVEPEVKAKLRLLEKTCMPVSKRRFCEVLSAGH